MTTKTIVVPVDFSETTPRSLRYAAEMARKLTARLILMHVVENHPAHFVNTSPLGWYTSEAISRVSNQLQELGDDHFGKELEWSTTVRIHPVAEEAIVEQADLLDAEMIIMGTHGRRGLSRFLLGSTAEHVVRRARRPVLTVGLNDETRPQAA
jgi:universal stress protein A